MSRALLNSPAVGFEQPFEMLQACHERVLQRLDLLQRLAEHLQQHGADHQAQGAAADLLRYFDHAAPHHHEDEERHVLPRLRATGHSALAERLAEDHGRMHAGWLALRPFLLAVQAGQASKLDEGWRDWAALYRRHIEAEETSAFPAAQAACSASESQAMGEEMAQRRR